MTRRILLLAALIAGCTPSPAATPGASTAPSAAPSAPAGSAAPTGGAATSTYTSGSLTVDGTAVTLPTKMTIVKVPNGDAVSRVFGIGIPAEAQVGGWFAIVTYAIQGKARNLGVQLNQKTGPSAADLLFLSFNRIDMGTGGDAMIVQKGATGTATEHDGVVDVSFEGELAGIPTSKHQVKASFPGLPLN